MSNSLQDWLANDPNPAKTIDLVKKKIERNKKLSADDPVRLMREQLTPEEFNTYWEEKKALEADFLFNKGWSTDKTIKVSWYVPQLVVNANPDHWDEVFMKKQYTKYPYFLLGNPYAGKNLNVTSRFKA